MIDDERFERLFSAVETLVNASARIVRAMESRQTKPASSRSPRSPRAALEKKIEVTPLIEARVKQALARVYK